MKKYFQAMGLSLALILIAFLGFFIAMTRGHRKYLAFFNGFVKGANRHLEL